MAVGQENPLPCSGFLITYSLFPNPLLLVILILYLHQNYLEGMLKHRCLGPTHRTSGCMGLENLYL